jgi:TetR/AcrR family transcriptional repressor of nem operon
MPRKKAYIEEEVIEKAMDTFWENGYEATSVRLLEEKMGINQFSIYSSFGSKEGVFIRSMECYNDKLKKEILNKLINSNGGLENIKQYFYDFLIFIKHKDVYKGCLLTNSINELDPVNNKELINKINGLATKIHTTFQDVLLRDDTYNIQSATKMSNYLLVALQGLSVASKSLNKNQLYDFIEITFKT